MSSINLHKTQYASLFAGLRAEEDVNFTIDISAVNLSAGQFVEVVHERPLDNANNISSTAVKISPLETFYRVVDGYTIGRYPSWAAATYEVGIVT